MMNRRSALGNEDEGAGADAACSGTLAPAQYLNGLYTVRVLANDVHALGCYGTESLRFIT